MLNFHDLEEDLRLELADDSLCLEREVFGGIVNKAAHFRSVKTGQSFLVKYNFNKDVRIIFCNKCITCVARATPCCV